MCPLVEGGQRAIIFNRIGGMQMDTVLAEGLHFRYETLSALTHLKERDGGMNVN